MKFSKAMESALLKWLKEVKGIAATEAWISDFYVDSQGCNCNPGKIYLDVGYRYPGERIFPSSGMVSVEDPDLFFRSVLGGYEV